MDNRATQQYNVFPMFICSLLAGTSQFSVFVGQKMHWLAERILITCVMRHVRTHKLQMSEPTVHFLSCVRVIYC